MDRVIYCDILCMFLSLSCINLCLYNDPFDRSYKPQSRDLIFFWKKFHDWYWKLVLNLIVSMICPSISLSQVKFHYHTGAFEYRRWLVGTNLGQPDDKYLFAILIWSVVFLSPILLIPQHNAIKNPTYWYESMLVGGLSVILSILILNGERKT